LLLTAALTPICWLATLLSLHAVRRALPEDGLLEDGLDAVARYAWAAGAVAALTLTACLAALGVPPFAVAPDPAPVAPAPTALRPEMPAPVTPIWRIPALEEMSDAELAAFVAGRPGLVREETHHYVIAGGRRIPADRAEIDLTQFPTPRNNTGRGIHWIPTTGQSPAVVDQFVARVEALGMRWVVFLNGLDDHDYRANTYLVPQLTARGIEPVMRLVSPVQPLDATRLAEVMAVYRPLGVRYVQIFNEPNLDREWGGGEDHSPERFARLWAGAATVVLSGGGLPGLAAMAPGGDQPDDVYLARALAQLLALGRYDLLNRTWLAVHNYTGGRPDDYVADRQGFGRYRTYAAITTRLLGAPLPMIGAEGGPVEATAEQEAEWIGQAFEHMAARREPYWLAFCPWLLANAAGGGHDRRWEAAAWYQVDGARPVVAALGGTAE
jgi:hypothetical protein